MDGRNSWRALFLTHMKMATKPTEMAELEASLGALEASILEQLSAALVFSQVPDDESHRRALLDHPARLAALLAAASATEFVGAYRQALRVVKELCRLVIRYVSVVAGNPEDAAQFLLLDDALCCLLEPVAVLAQQVAAASLDDMSSEKELARWVPFAVCASCFVCCGKLPASDLMKSVAVADCVLASCCSVLRVDDRSLVLSKFISQISALCNQGVTKEQWVDPSSYHKHVLLWAVEQVKLPHLGGDLLGRLLALAFPLVDDLRDETQLVGAKLLCHIVKNVTATELRWYSDVLLEVLRVSLTTRKPATLDCLLDCLTESLAKVSPPGEIRFYDQFMPRLLTDTSLCSDVGVRAVLLKRMRPIIERMGAPHSLQLIRYLQPLLKVLTASFDSINVDLLVEALETLRATVLGAWPRISGHIEEILVAVLRAVAFCELFDDGEGSFAASPEQKKRVLPLCEDAIALLHDVDGPMVLNMLQTVGDECVGLKRFADGLRGQLARVEVSEPSP